MLCCPIRPTVIDVVDRDVADALARSFFAELPTELADRLQAEGERADYPAGTTVYRAGDDPQGRSAGHRPLRRRPGDVLGIAVLVGGPARTSVQTVEPI